MPLSPSPSSPKPAIILDHPQMGENIGAAARAMLNFGLEELRLVAPRDGWPSKAAEDMAVGALEKMPPVKVFDTLAEALGDLHRVLATTARPRDMVKEVFTPQTAALNLHEATATGQKTGLVFGGERAGLSNDDVALCNGIITIPTNPDFSSINLGQAVLLVASAWFGTQKQAQDAPPHHIPQGDSFPVTQDRLEEFLTRLEGELEQGGFFRSEGLKPTMVRNIRNIFTRPSLTDQEVRTLHGIVSALKKNKHTS